LPGLRKDWRCNPILARHARVFIFRSVPGIRDFKNRLQKEKIKACIGKARLQTKDASGSPGDMDKKSRSYFECRKRETMDARGILYNKGLTDGTIRCAEIGFNPIDLYRDRRGWGLSYEVRCDGKPKLLWIPAGLAIPLSPFPRQKAQGHAEGVTRLRIRRTDPGDGPRYVIVAGSTMAPLVLESEKKIFTIVESELDAWLCWQEAADLTGIMAMGAAGMKPDVLAHELLLKAEIILNALDHDAAGARYAWKFWQETYGPKIRRWPVPIGKDPSDAWQRGLNIRAWIEAGIADN